MGRINCSAGLLLLAISATTLIAQFLVRPAVGIANNNDFAKMSGPLALGPEQGDWESHKQYGEFVYLYIKADRYLYNSPFSAAEFVSSEFFFVKLARALQKIFQPGPRFDIRWMGSVHGAFLLFAIAVWIYAFTPPWRLYAGLLAVFIWTDVAYVQYLNSFYMDAAAIVCLLLCVAAGLHAIQDRNSRVFPLVTTGAALLFAASKSQHAVPALVFIPLFLSLAFWSRNRAARATWVSGSVLLVVCVGGMLLHDSAEYRSANVFYTVFVRIVPAAPDRLRALEELGLGREEFGLVGTYAFLSNSPMSNPEWVAQFGRRCNYATLFRYYLRHPSVPVHFLYQDLSGPASHLRPWGNLSPDDGFKPGAQAAHFGYWSDFRSWLFRRAPWHSIVLLCAAIGSALWLLLLSPPDRPLAGLALAVQILAIMEYGIAILADAVETARHLILFHAAIDISILLLPLLISRIYVSRRKGRFPADCEEMLFAVSPVPASDPGR